MAGVAEWLDNSSSANNLENLPERDNKDSGSDSFVLYTNKDVQIITDDSDAVRLSKEAVHILVTEYELEYDAGGMGRDDSRIIGWTDHDCSGNNGPQVIDIREGRAVEISLSAEAPKSTVDTANSDHCIATQTFTVCWK